MVDKRLVRYVLWGAIAFASSFFFIYTIRSVTPNALITNWETGLRLDAFWFACACGLSGILLGLANRAKLNAALIGLAAIAGCMPVYYETARIVSSVFEYQVLDSFYLLTVTVMIQFVIIGIVTGAWVGSVQRSWEQVGWSALAGGIGFGLSALIAILGEPKAMGVFIGAALGWAFGLREVNRSRESSPVEEAVSQRRTKKVMITKGLVSKVFRLFLFVALGFVLGLLVWLLLVSQGRSQGIIGLWKFIYSLIPFSAILLVISLALHIFRGRKPSLELSVSSQILLILAFWVAMIYVAIGVVRDFTPVQPSIEMIIYTTYIAVGLTAIVSALVILALKRLYIVSSRLN